MIVRRHVGWPWLVSLRNCRRKAGDQLLRGTEEKPRR